MAGLKRRPNFLVFAARLAYFRHSFITLFGSLE